MINDYLEHVINKLTWDDFKLLGILHTKNITEKYRAMSYQKIFKLSNLSEAIFRKIIYRLTATGFIEVNTGRKEHSMFLTEYGVLAVQSIQNKEMEGVVV